MILGVHSSLRKIKLVALLPVSGHLRYVPLVVSATVSWKEYS